MRASITTGRRSCDDCEHGPYGVEADLEEFFVTIIDDGKIIQAGPLSAFVDLAEAGALLRADKR